MGGVAADFAPRRGPRHSDGVRNCPGRTDRLDARAVGDREADALGAPTRSSRRTGSRRALAVVAALAVGAVLGACSRNPAGTEAGSAVTVDVSGGHAISQAPAPLPNDVLTVERPSPLTITFGQGRVLSAADASQVGFDAVGPNPEQIGEITVRFSGLGIDEAYARAQDLSVTWAPDKPAWLESWRDSARTTDPASLGPRPVGGTDRPIGGPGGPAASIEIVPSGDPALPYFVEIHFFWPDHPVPTPQTGPDTRA